MKYLKQFVVGSSWLVFSPFFYNVYNAIENIKKEDPNHFNIVLPQKSVPFYWPKKYNFYSYFRYTMTAPIWFGVWNVISFIIAEHFGFNIRKRIFIISIISLLSMMLNQAIYNTYNFKNKEEYMKYYMKLSIMYMIIWNILIYNIEINI